MSINFPDSPVLDEIFTIGNNSTNNGSLGWYFVAGASPGTGKIYYGSFNVTTMAIGSTPVTAVYYGSIKVL